MSAEWVIYVSRRALHRSRPRRFLPRRTCCFGVIGARGKALLCSEWWVGIRLVGVWPRSKVGWAPSDARYLYGRPVVKRRSAAAAAGDGVNHLAAMETTLFQQLLPIVEHCAFVRYDDGEQRQPGWVTIKTLGAAWVVQVKDPDSANSFQFVADTLDKALEGAALLLSCEEAPWQPDAFLKKQKGK